MTERTINFARSGVATMREVDPGSEAGWVVDRPDGRTLTIGGWWERRGAAGRTRWRYDEALAALHALGYVEATADPAAGAVGSSAVPRVEADCDGAVQAVDALGVVIAEQAAEVDRLRSLLASARRFEFRPLGGGRRETVTVSWRGPGAWAVTRLVGAIEALDSDGDWDDATWDEAEWTLDEAVSHLDRLGYRPAGGTDA